MTVDKAKGKTLLLCQVSQRPVFIKLHNNETMDDLNRSMDLSLATNAFAHLISAGCPDPTFSENAAKRLEDMFETVALLPE